MTVYVPLPPPVVPPPCPATVSPAIMPPEWLRKHVLRAIIERYHFRRGAEIGLGDGQTTGYLLAECPALQMIGVDARRVFENNPLDDFASWNHEWLRERTTEAIGPNADRVQIIDGVSWEQADRIPDGSLDFVFIDADHSEDACRKDIAAWLPKLRADGMMTGHDINWPGVRAAVDDMMPGYQIGPDVVWFRPVHPAPNWWSWLYV